MSPFNRRKVENYTNAFLVTLGVFFFMSFWVIAAALGYVWVFITAFCIDKLFLWLGNRQRNSV